MLKFPHKTAVRGQMSGPPLKGYRVELWSSFPCPASPPFSRSSHDSLRNYKLCSFVCTWASLVAQTVRIHLQCGRPRFDPWVGKIPWRRRRQPAPVFLPGNLRGQRSLAGCRESDRTERLSACTLQGSFWPGQHGSENVTGDPQPGRG